MSEPPLVAALVYDGLCTFEFAIAAEVFGLPRPELGAPLYRFVPVAVEDGPLTAAGGLTVRASGGLELLAVHIDVSIFGGSIRSSPLEQIALQHIH